MKNAKIVFLMVTTIMLSSLQMHADNPKRFSEGTQIQQILKSIPSPDLTEHETKVNITFIVNSQSQIVVLDTNNNRFDEVIKTLLNYKTIRLTDLKQNVVYTLPVLFK